VFIKLDTSRDNREFIEKLDNELNTRFPLESVDIKIIDNVGTILDPELTDITGDTVLSVSFMNLIHGFEERNVIVETLASDGYLITQNEADRDEGLITFELKEPRYRIPHNLSFTVEPEVKYDDSEIMRIVGRLAGEIGRENFLLTPFDWYDGSCKLHTTCLLQPKR
jgi:hypothetical protein